MATTRVRAGIYCRISDDQEGEGLGVARQEEDCRRLADQRGWDVAGVYTDNSISAFKRKKRPEFERLLAYLGPVGSTGSWFTTWTATPGSPPTSSA